MQFFLCILTYFKTEYFKFSLLLPSDGNDNLSLLEYGNCGASCSKRAWTVFNLAQN